METENSENSSENVENKSDRESSIESFHTNQSEFSTATESELIDIDDIELSDEESWLYKSPKKTSHASERSDKLPKQLEPPEAIEKDKPKESRHDLLGKLNQLRNKDSSNENKRGEKVVPVSGHSIANTSKEKQTNAESASSTNIEENYVDKDNPTIKECKIDAKQETKTECLNWRSQEVLDVNDVQKLARLQEESLKQSIYKCPSQSGIKTPSSRDFSPDSSSLALNLSKPASIEGLNTCHDRINPSNMYSISPMQGMKKQSNFSSSSALDSSPDYHRSSLPNINKEYFILKSKKPKRPSEPKVSCPLPIYPTSPKKAHNGPQVQAPCALNALVSHDHRQSSTLPSSYRSNSRRNSANSRSNSLSRRDSSPFSFAARQGSTPALDKTIFLNSPNTYRKFSSPMPLNTVAISPTKAFAQSQASVSPTSPDHYRAASHSPARRWPLSMVQHPLSPQRENSWKTREKQQSPGKVIPTVQNRSGIPKPASGQLGDNWSQDFY